MYHCTSARYHIFFVCPLTTFRKYPSLTHGAMLIARPNGSFGDIFPAGAWRPSLSGMEVLVAAEFTRADLAQV